MQYELDLHYHHESIDIFFNALRMMDANGTGANSRPRTSPRSNG